MPGTADRSESPAGSLAQDQSRREARSKLEPPPPPPPEPESPRPSLMDDLYEANGSFAINLLKMLGEEDSSRNVFFSPLSISSALAMVFMGAKGNTAAQMSQALCLNRGGEIHQGFRSLLQEVNKSGTQYLLRTANRLFGEKTCDFLPKLKYLRTGDGRRMGANCQAHYI